MGYPTKIYHDTKEPRVVDSDECEALLAEGWRDHPVRENMPADLEKADKFDVLKKQANILGIKVDGRSTVDSLTKRIANG
jgi:hypothetical protein